MRKLLSLLSLLFFTACSTYQTIDIDVLSPSVYSFPTGTKSIVILNNANEQAPDVGHYTYRHNITTAYSTRPKMTSKDKIKVDSTTISALYNMANELNNSSLLPPVKVGRTQNSPLIDIYTAPDYLDKYNADVLLVLDKVSYRDELTHVHYSYFNLDEDELKVITNTQWQIYSRLNNSSPYRFMQSDTLYWTAPEVDRKACIQEAVWTNAGKAARKVAPYWLTVNRLYFTGAGLNYQEIDKNIKNDHWEEAAKVWMQIYKAENKNTLKKARMAYNMALFFEIKNDLKSSAEWLGTAISIFKEKNAESELSVCALYVKILDQRMTLQKMLDKQLSF